MRRRPSLKTGRRLLPEEKLGYAWAAVFVAVVVILLVTLVRP